MADKNKSRRRSETTPPKSDISRREMLAGVGASAAGAAGLAATASAKGAEEPEKKFDPNRLTFEQGVERIKKALDGRTLRGIVTSRDPRAAELLKALQVDNVPQGFQKHQLPVYFEKDIPGVQFFISVGAPNTQVRKHAHNEGDGIRFIVGGSIVYDGKELTQGDWMFIPQGEPYAFTVGRHGAVICYCYCCCCA